MYELIASVIDAKAAPLGAEDTRPVGQRQAEALADVFGYVADHGDTTVLPDTGGRRPHVSVLIRLEDLENRARAACLEFAGVATPAALRLLCCDACVIPVVLGGAGQPLDVGRKARTIPAALRRAVVARDRGCAHPGCDRPVSWCEIHHIKPWEAGGDTKLSNLVMLCKVHHRQIHFSGWSVRIAPDGLPEFYPPTWVDPEQTPPPKTSTTPTTGTTPTRQRRMTPISPTAIPRARGRFRGPFPATPARREPAGNTAHRHDPRATQLAPTNPRAQLAETAHSRQSRATAAAPHRAPPDRRRAPETNRTTRRTAPIMPTRTTQTGPTSQPRHQADRPPSPSQDPGPTAEPDHDHQWQGVPKAAAAAPTEPSHPPTAAPQNPRPVKKRPANYRNGPATSSAATTTAPDATNCTAASISGASSRSCPGPGDLHPQPVPDRGGDRSRRQRGPHVQPAGRGEQLDGQHPAPARRSARRSLRAADQPIDT